MSRRRVTPSRSESPPGRKWVEVNQVEPEPNRPTSAPAQARAGDAPGGTVSVVGMVNVQPKHPPGQRSRKARRYVDQIRNLKAQGYTLDDIREALADAGVVVSKSTVQREASRRPPSAYQPDRPMAPPPPMPPTIDGLNTEPQPAAAPPSQAMKQSGKDIAAAYFAANNFNPLFRKDQR